MVSLCQNAGFFADRVFELGCFYEDEPGLSTVSTEVLRSLESCLGAVFLWSVVSLVRFVMRWMQVVKQVTAACVYSGSTHEGHF